MTSIARSSLEHARGSPRFHAIKARIGVSFHRCGFYNVALDPSFLAEHSAQPEAIQPSLLDYYQWVEYVLSPSGFLTKRYKACEQAGSIPSSNGVAGQLLLPGDRAVTSHVDLPNSNEANRRDYRQEPVGANDVWAMDFVHDQLATGKKLRILTVVYTHSRYCPAAGACFTYRGEDVVQTLEGICGKIGYPKSGKRQRVHLP